MTTLFLNFLQRDDSRCLHFVVRPNWVSLATAVLGSDPFFCLINLIQFDLIVSLLCDETFCYVGSLFDVAPIVFGFLYLVSCLISLTMREQDLRSYFMLAELN